MSMLHIHDAFFFLLPVSAECLCKIFIMHVHTAYIHAGCPCCLSKVHVQATAHVQVACQAPCQYCMAILLLLAACLFTIYMLHVPTVCPRQMAVSILLVLCCMAMLYVHAACPCWCCMSFLNVIETESFMSILHVRAACP